MSYEIINERHEHGVMQGISISNTTEAYCGWLHVRVCPRGLAERREDFTCRANKDGCARALAAMAQGMLVYDAAGRLLTAEDLQEN